MSNFHIYVKSSKSLSGQRLEDLKELLHRCFQATLAVKRDLQPAGTESERVFNLASNLEESELKRRIVSEMREKSDLQVDNIDVVKLRYVIAD